MTKNETTKLVQSRIGKNNIKPAYIKLNITSQDAQFLLTFLSGVKNKQSLFDTISDALSVYEAQRNA